MRANGGLPLSDDFTLTRRPIGLEQQPLVVGTNFLRDAHRLKRFAVDKASFQQDPGYYPGLRMNVPNVYVRSLVNHFADVLLRYFDIRIADIKSVRSSYSIVTTKAENLKFLQKIPHFDLPLMKGVALLHYLCDPVSSGTSFYRHRSTGYEFIDGNRIDTYSAELEKEFSYDNSRLDGYISGSTERFERIEGEEAEFNKILMYRGASLHCGDIGPSYTFDPNPATGRLTISTFILAE